jgi:2-dehydropantoate 2-reductase
MNTCAVIGIGPVGGILGAHLLKSGMDVTLIEIIPERLQSIQSNGIRIKDPQKVISGDFVVSPDKILSSIKEMPECPEYIFVCTKAYSLEKVIADIFSACSSSTEVIIFQNGLDNEEKAAEILGKDNVFRCINNFAGMMTPDARVDVTFFNRPNYIGVLEGGDIEQAKKLADIMTEAGIETEYTTDLKTHEWKKSILNACLASITAVTGYTMKEVLDFSLSKDMVIELLAEGVAVAESAGAKLPENFSEFCMSYLSKGGYHKPSMLIDIEQGRETEVDYLSGKIVEYGNRLNVPVQHNWMITALIKAIEHKQGNRG